MKAQLTLLACLALTWWLGCSASTSPDTLATHAGKQQEATAAPSDKQQIEPLPGKQPIQPAATKSSAPAVLKCSRQSILLARQTLAHQLDTINAYNQIWFNDLDKEELLEEQRASLANIIVSGLSNQLLDSDGQPMFELEASYFRAFNVNQLPLRAAPTSNAERALPASTSHHDSTGQPISIKLLRRHADRCFLHKDKNLYTYLFGISIGPIEHNLDVAYNLPKEFRLSQPIGWRYAQFRVLVPKMNYEVSLKQVANYNLTSQSGGCPIEVAELTYLSSTQPSKVAVAVVANGLAANNQTLIHLERLFNDYTRPIVSRTLRQVLKFYLNSKTLPLSVAG